MAENSRNRSNLAIVPVAIFRGRALSSICASRPGTLDPLISRRKRNTETRDRGHVLWVSRIVRVSLTQGRASQRYWLWREVEGTRASG